MTEKFIIVAFMDSFSNFRWCIANCLLFLIHLYCQL